MIPIITCVGDVSTGTVSQIKYSAVIFHCTIVHRYRNTSCNKQLLHILARYECITNNLCVIDKIQILYLYESIVYG